MSSNFSALRRPPSAARAARAARDDYLSTEFARLSTASGRDQWVSSRVNARSAEFTRLDTLSVWGGTWNVNGQDPSPIMDLRAWLLAPEGDPLRHDVYMVGFQEVQPLVSLVTDTSAGWRWVNQVSRVLNATGDHYALVAKKQLVGILLLVFLKKRHKEHLDGVYYSYAGTGFMKAGGNKGAVAAYLMLYNKTISCVSCHLTAHDGNMERRNQDFHEVVRKAVFSPSNPTASPVPPPNPPTNSDTLNSIFAMVADSVAGGNAAAMASPDAIRILDSDAVFWLGDLNYRINLPAVEVLRLIKSKSWDVLTDADQLKISMSQKASFDDFQEGPIKFAPTYKLHRRFDEYERNEEGELKRIPSYTDRILWRIHERDRGSNFVRLESYERCATMGSDHRPVRALFTINVGATDKARRRRVERQIQEDADHTLNRLRPAIAVSDHNPQLGRVAFGVPRSVSIVVRSKGPTPASVSIPTSEFPDWLSLENPADASFVVSSGSDKTLRFRAHVNSASESSISLGCGTESLSITVRLIIKNGGEAFVTLEGDYKTTAWGTSFDTLVLHPEPMRFAKRRRETERELQPLPIPKEIWQLMDALKDANIDEYEDELFADAEDLSAMDELKKCVDTGSEIDDSFDPLLIATCLLDLLRSLHSPVIPSEWYGQVVATGRIRPEADRLLDALPAVNANVLRYVGGYLAHINASRKVIERVARVMIRVPPGKREGQDMNKRTRFMENIVKNAQQGYYKGVIDVGDLHALDKKVAGRSGDHRDRRQRNHF